MDNKIIEQFKHFMTDETPVFNSYVKRKANGEKLDFELLGPTDLHEMFIEEVIIDNLIADLFDVTKEVVKKKRYKYDIKQGRSFPRKLIQMLTETIDWENNINEKPQKIDYVHIPQ